MACAAWWMSVRFQSPATIRSSIGKSSEITGASGHRVHTYAGVGRSARRARKDSPNTGWRNLSFRGFADYMQTPEFEQGLQKLIELSANERVAIMCAEAVP